MASRKFRLARRITFMLIFILVIYGGVIGFNRFMGAKILEAMASMPKPVASVSVATAQNQTWPDQVRAVGSLKADQGSVLTAQSSGIITALHFKSGQTVKKGRILVQLNDNVERAQLAADQARLVNAKQEMQRQRQLYTRKATSQTTLQAAEATYRTAQAVVETDRAKLDNLQVRAPFDGHLGIRLVSLGQYVSPGTGLVDLQQWNPLRVEFSVPQRDLAKITVGNPLSLTVDGINHRTFSGRVTAIGSAISTDTRAVTVQAEVQNADNALRPGMFGNVVARLAKQRQLVAIPSLAITYNTYGEYVYVVKDSGERKIVEQRIVRSSGTRNGLAEITRGIKPGDVVVTAGQVNLYPKARVKVVPLPSGLDASSTSASGD